MYSYSKKHRILSENANNLSLRDYLHEQQKQLDSVYKDAKLVAMETLKKELEALLKQTESEKRVEFLTYAISSICQKHPTAALALERSLELLKKKNVDLESKIWVEGIKRIRELISINPNDYRLPQQKF